MNNGLCYGNVMLPTLSLVTNAEAGSVIDYTFYLVGDTTVNDAYLAKLGNVAANASAPVFYGPTYSFSGELATIVDNLRANVNAAQDRTNLLDNIQAPPP